MKRREDIDILKSIGLICIILAHVNPPKYIFQLRNFDVVLMILVSAYLGLCSTKKMNYFEYVYKRAIRLIIPTWIFLIVFFIINSVYILCYVDKKIVLSSFLLGKGIGYDG